MNVRMTMTRHEGVELTYARFFFTKYFTVLAESSIE